MRTDLSPDEIFKGFELLSIRDMNAEELLQSEIPEEVILAILADYDKKQSDVVIRSIIERLKILCENKKSLGKYSSQLTILSKLRNLEVITVQNIKAMQMQELLDVTTTILYKEGLEKGIEKGIEKGMARGLERLEQSLEKKLLVFIANMHFADFPLKQIADLTGADVKKVKIVKEKLTSKEWRHPDNWTDEEWEKYFDENNSKS